MPLAGWLCVSEQLPCLLLVLQVMESYEVEIEGKTYQARLP